MNPMVDISVLLPVIGILTVVTNIIVEVLKKITYNIIPTQFLAAAIAEGLTWAVYMYYIMTNTIPVFWFHHVAAVVVGFMVAYAAMFGFDTLRNALEVKNNG